MTPAAAWLNDLDGPLWLAFHDAGAANFAFAWLEGFRGETRAWVEGPAARLWARAFPGRPTWPAATAALGARLLLSGSGWASHLEHEARVMARRLGIRSIAVVDHWVNYPQRFVRAGATVLPDEIWVGDAEAAARARASFPNVLVTQWPNRYLAREAEEIRARAVGPLRIPPQEILYLLEPIRETWGADPRPGEFQALAYFLDRLPDLGIPEGIIVRLRPHPSDPPGKYADRPARYPWLRLVVDDRAGLAAQIAQADWVVGCQTYGLVVALEAGRVAISSLPPWAPPCPLPQAELRHLRDMPAPALGHSCMAVLL